MPSETPGPSTRTHYRNLVMDSARWDGFEFRDGDIVISTPPKCGTTWTQMICALLVFGRPDLPGPLDLLSPWLDQTLRPLDEVIADLESQTHRRFIKSHTPFDGLPIDDRVTYICVGRDPRDVGVSWAHHIANIDSDAFLALRTRAVGLDDLAAALVEAEPPPDRTEADRLRAFFDSTGDPGDIDLEFVLHHLASFWRERHRPNVVLLHYRDLAADLDGQMQSLAARLGTDVSGADWAELADAATFDRMRRRPAVLAPNTSESIWNDPGAFFRSGTSGQWRALLDDGDVARYLDRVRDLVDDDLAHWVHHGSSPAG